MAFDTFYGFGLSGDPLISGGAMLHQSSVYWIDSVNGSDANPGTSPTAPKKTLANLLGGSITTGSIYILMPGFSETLTANATINETLTIIGAGKLGDKPAAEIGFDSTAQLILAGAATDLIAFRNVRFLTRADASTNARISATLASQYIVFEGCWWECDDSSETLGSLDINDATYVRLTDCTFESTAQYNDTTQAPAPQACAIDNAGIVYIENCRLLGGEGGWDLYSLGVTSGNKVYVDRMEATLGSRFSLSGTGWCHVTGSVGTAVLEAFNMNFHYAPGKGAALGPVIATTGRMATTLRTIYVSSVIGDDTYDGSQRQRPFATLGAAIASVTAGFVGNTVIVLAADHDETLTSSLAFGYDGFTIIGEGLDADGEPTAKIRFNGNGAQIVMDDDTQIYNVRFMPNEQANASPRVTMVADDAYYRIRDCVWECDQYDTQPGLYIEGNTTPPVVHLRNVTFRSVQSDPALAPGTPLAMAVNANVVFMDDVTFDGGGSGFTGEACDLDDVEHVHAVNLRLLNGADMHVLQGLSTSNIILHFAANSESTYVYTEAPGG